MDETFKPHQEYCCVYVDDLLIFSNTLKDHYAHVIKILLVCKSKGVILSEKKATLVQTKIKFLGLGIEEGKRQLQSHILTHIWEFPSEIKDKNQLQRFLGCLTYAEAYIKK